MRKVLIETAPFLVPTPTLLLSAAGSDGAVNVMTVSLVGVACGTPPMVSVAIRPERHSYGLIRETGEFVLNVPSAALLRAVDFCGSVSGATVDKCTQAHLTPVTGVKVQAPLIEECPLNLECVVRNSLVLGSHVLFLAEVVAVHADDEVVQDDAVVAGRIAPLAYDPFGGDYWSLKEVVGHQGFSEGRMPDRSGAAPRAGD
jgi:flavin reductase (DIM6/NTAB) family NADH-FMN oxidoreductase RutF